MSEAMGGRDVKALDANRRTRCRRRLLAAGVVPLAMAVLAPTALAAKNVNFVGTWKVKAGASFTITKENRKTGSCAGRSSLAPSGYKLVACKVRGRKYSFTITYGPSYKSRNTGTISGNKLTGTFHDTNGTVESYTAKRSGKH